MHQGTNHQKTNPTIEAPPPNKTTSFASQNLIGVEDRIHRDSKGLQPLKTPPSYTQGPVKDILALTLDKRTPPKPGEVKISEGLKLPGSFVIIDNLNKYSRAKAYSQTTPPTEVKPFLAKDCTFLEDLDIKYEFSLHNFLNLFQDNINNFSNSLSLMDEGCFISLPIEILRKNNFLNCFCKNFIDKNNFKTENIEVRFASHILTHGRFTSFEESKAYFVLGRFSEDNVTLYFDIFDFNQLYNYMLEQKPLICPSTINRLLTVADYYDYKTLNSSFLIPLDAFI